MTDKTIQMFASELKPGSKYLLAFDEGAVTLNDLHSLMKGLRTLGIENAIAIVTRGNPNEVINIIEQE